MIRLLGASVILFATTVSGILIARGYRNRPKELRQWRSALQAMESEILYGKVPIEELADHLSQQLPAPVSFFFRDLHRSLASGKKSLLEAWNETIEDFWPATSLKRAEKEIIIQFGATLGTQDADNQKKHIQLTLAHLEREEQEARAARAANEKMIKSLGFLAGLLIVLLFL
ncbi:stage III sporulation protein SpoAB [Sporolactobacillus sp. THM7-7]|nr:stage III sporulation protein SpoAB [Sporolactobacillus sp. THM7-7]